MVRIRIGEGWVSDPAVRAGLRSAVARTRRAAVRSIVDVLAVEVEGVDIGAGRTEGALAGGVLALLGAVERLAQGEEHASVPFDDGAVELLLHRRGGNALLSVASLSRPARVLAHDVEVDLAGLSDAARAAAAALHDRVAEISPAARALPELRALLRATIGRTVSPREGVRAIESTRSGRHPRLRRDAACSFEIVDDSGRLSSFRGEAPDLTSLLVPGRVAVRSPAGESILSVGGVPYLLLRDLSAAAARIALSHGAPVSFDLARPGRRATARVLVADGAVAVDRAGAVRCDPLAFAQAVLEGSADFCAVVRRRAPAQRRNALLVDLEAFSTQALAQVKELREGDRRAHRRRNVRSRRARHPGAPIAPGTLRSVTFEPLPAFDVGPPAGGALFLDGERLIASGSGRTLSVNARTGAPLWEAPGARLCTAAGRSVALLRDGWFELRGAETGELAWRRRTPPDLGPRPTITILPEGRFLASSGPSVHAYALGDGASLWSFRSPGAARVFLLPLGGLALVASHAGLVHALDAHGDVVWRLRGAGTLTGLPSASARSCLLCFRSPAGTVLSSVESGTGRRIFDAPLDFTPAGAPVRFAGRIGLAGRVAGDGVVAALEEDGSQAWVEHSPTGSIPVLAERPTGLLAKGSDGTCASLDRSGHPAWLRSCEGREAVPGNLAPVAAHGLVLVPSSEVALLDATSGAPVGCLPGHAPARFIVAPDLTTWTLDADGLLTGARLRGFLSALNSPPRP